MKSYFDHFPDTSLSANIIVPKIIEIVGTPAALVELGGGVGLWCKVFKDQGVQSVLCIDNPNLPRSELKIDPEEFLGCDLSERFPDPVPSDLAISLEVAEHLEDSRAEGFVEFLTQSAPVVVFSAAIPGQPSDGHINAQPMGYWIEKFNSRGYEFFDVIRPNIIDDSRIPYWYRQNTIVFAGGKTWINRLREVQANNFYRSIPEDFELVHQRILNIYRKKSGQVGLKSWLKAFAPALQTSFRNHFK